MFGLPSPVYLIAAALFSFAALMVVITTGGRGYSGAGMNKTTVVEVPQAQKTLEDNDGAGVAAGPETATRLLGEGGREAISQDTARRNAQRQTPGVSGVAAADESMTMTVPRLGLDGVPIPSGSTQRQLDREGILRMSDSGLPWEAGSNTFIVGHTLGYQGTKVPYAFYNLDEMKPGDRITVKDSSGRSYDFEVYDEMTVRPEDYWVTYPERDGRTTISLQNCVPIPEFDMRLVVRAELVEENRS